MTVALAAAVREASAPTPALPRERGRGQAAARAKPASTFDIGSSSYTTRSRSPVAKLGLASRHGELPLPLAGEGWGEGDAGTAIAMDDPKRPIWKVSRRVLANARALRRNSTDAERLLWSELRDRRLLGFGFRRQVPIGGFIADFACHAAKLVIELDGGQHFSDDAERRDAARTAAIEAHGFRVVRFGNHEVMSNRAGVLQSIADVLAASALTPALSRKREREQAADADQLRPEQGGFEQRRLEQSGPEQSGLELSDLPNRSASDDAE